MKSKINSAQWRQVKIKLIKLVALLLYSLFANAVQWSVPVDSTEKLLPAQASIVQSIETGDGTMWRLVIPEYVDQNYVYFERFDPTTGTLKNKSVFKVSNYDNTTSVYFSGILAGGYDSVCFYARNLRRIITSNLTQKDYYYEAQPPFPFVPRFKYRDLPDRTEVIDPATNNVLRVILLEEKARLPQAQAISESGDKIFYAELFELKSQLVVLLSAHRKVDGALLWRKRLETSTINHIFNNDQYSGQGLQLSSAGGTVTLTASEFRFKVENSTLWMIGENSGDTKWQQVGSMPVDGIFYKSIYGTSTPLGNSVISVFGASGSLLRGGNGEFIRSVPSIYYFLPGGGFLAFSPEGISKINEPDGNIAWSLSRENSNYLKVLCVRGNNVVFAENRGAQSLVGHFSLIDGSEVSAQIPTVSRTTVKSAPYSALRSLKNCQPGPTIARSYIGEINSVAIAFNDNGAEVWRLPLSIQGVTYQSAYSIGEGIRFSWYLENYLPANGSYFVTQVSDDGIIRPSYMSLSSELYEANSRHVKISVVDQEMNRFEVRQFRRDVSTNFTIARLDSEEVREVVDLVSSIQSLALENGAPSWVIRVTNIARRAAKSARITSDQGPMTYSCMPGPGANCRDGDGNRILSAEVDLPENGGYVDIRIKKPYVGYASPLIAIPGFDQLEASPENNLIDLNEFFFFNSFE